MLDSSSAWGNGTCITSQFITPNGIKTEIHIPSLILSFGESLNPSIFFVEVLYHVYCKQKHSVLPH